MPKIDVSQLPFHEGSGYPEPLRAAVEGRRQQRLTDAGGLTQFGANLVRLAPGAASALRHWHEEQDELVMITEGTPVLIDEAGETPLAPGDVCAFPAGDANGHHIVNRSESEAAFLVVGTRTPTETGWYPDHDLKVEVSNGRMQFLRRDGSTLDGTPKRVASEPDFATFGSTLTRALIDGDFELYRTLWHLPASIEPRNGQSYTIDTAEALRADFALYAQAVREQGTLSIAREVLSQTAPETDARLFEVQMRIYDKDGLIVEPFVTTYRMERRGGDWRVARLISSLGHINWSLGRAGITEDRRFALD